MRIKLSEEVFKLIQSLSKTEKAYLKKSTLTRSSSQLSDAFDIINSFDDFDENATAEKLRTKGHEPRVIYKRLLPVLLKSLNQYHSGSTSEIQAQEMVITSRILLDKNLASLALNQMEKGISLAKEEQHLPALVKLINLKQTANTSKYSPSTNDDDENYQQALEAIGHLEQQIHYEHLYRRLIGLTQTSDTSKANRLKTISEILEHSAMQRSVEDSPQNFLTKNRICAVANFYVGRWEDALSNCKELLKRVPEFQSGEHSINMTRISLLLNTAHMHWATYNGPAFIETRKLIDEAEPFLSELPERNLAKVCTGIRAADQAHAISSGTLERSVDIGMQIIEGTKALSAPVDIKTAMLGIVLVQFLRGDYQKALQYINTTFLTHESTYLNDHIRWLELLCVFYGDDSTLFEAKWRSLNRHLKKVESGYDWEELILKALKKAYGKPKAEQQSVMSRLHQDLIPLQEEIRTRMPGVFDFVVWAESVAVGRPMILQIKEKYLK